MIRYLLEQKICVIFLVTIVYLGPKCQVNIFLKERRKKKEKKIGNNEKVGGEYKGRDMLTIFRCFVPFLDDLSVDNMWCLVQSAKLSTTDKIRHCSLSSLGSRH